MSHSLLCEHLAGDRVVNALTPVAATVSDIASAVAALAAMGALYFAWQTASEARQARREEALQHALHRIERVGELLYDIANDIDEGPRVDRILNTQKLLAATLASAGLDTRNQLPASTEIAAAAIGASNARTVWAQQTQTALEQVRDLLERLAGPQVLRG
jgi:phage-related minor tail protein